MRNSYARAALSCGADGAMKQVFTDVGRRVCRVDLGLLKGVARGEGSVDDRELASGIGAPGRGCRGRATGDMQGRIIGIARSTEVQILLAAATLFILFSLLYPDSFFSTGTFMNMARVAGILLVVSLGQSFALIVGGFDISVGATMGFVSIVIALFMVNGGDVAIAALSAWWPALSSVA